MVMLNGTKQASNGRVSCKIFAELSDSSSCPSSDCLLNKTSLHGLLREV